MTTNDANSENSHETPDDDADGQVSEVSKMDPAEADDPIVPDQATAGYPDAESGRPEEGTAGPNARPEDNEPRH